jgi:hypothetical protein
MIKRKYIGALMGGVSSGNLAEFFSLQCQFTTPDIAAQVVQQSFGLLLQLARRVPDERTFTDIVSGCLGRHLRTPPSA